MQKWSCDTWLFGDCLVVRILESEWPLLAGLMGSSKLFSCQSLLLLCPVPPHSLQSPPSLCSHILGGLHCCLFGLTVSLVWTSVLGAFLWLKSVMSSRFVIYTQIEIYAHTCACVFTCVCVHVYLHNELKSLGVTVLCELL